MDERLKNQPEESAATDLPESIEDPAATGFPESMEESDIADFPEGMEESGVTDFPESDITDFPEAAEESGVTEWAERTETESVTNRTERVVTERTETESVTERTERVETERVVTEEPERVETETESATETDFPEAAEESAAMSPETQSPPTGGPETPPTEETEPPPTKAEKLERKARRAENSVKEYQFAVLRTLILLVVLWVLFFKFIGLMRMPSDEMYPRIDAGDMVLYYRLDTDVRAQDIVVIRKSAPDSEEARLYILRVVAASGDTVEISDSDRLIINGSTMIESNIFYPTPRYEGFTEYPLTLGEDECFVLADSRNGGSDSRYFGPVRREEILGTVITILRRNNL